MLSCVHGRWVVGPNVNTGIVFDKCTGLKLDTIDMIGFLSSHDTGKFKDWCFRIRKGFDKFTGFKYVIHSVYYQCCFLSENV